MASAAANGVRPPPGFGDEAAALPKSTSSPPLRAQQSQPVSIMSGLAGSGPAGRAGGPPGISAANVHHEIARDIGQQVEMMILQAKRSSETKVGAEISKIKAKMDAMNEKIKLITERINRLDPAGGSILKADLQKSITKLEEVWESEVGTLKHELWQTIQAHNHNADLMKHHKDAIDQIQVRMNEAAPNPELDTIHSQLVAVDKVMQKEQAKQHQIDQFQQRLMIVQQQLTAGLSACWGGGVPFPMAGAVPRPMAANQAAAAAAAAAAGAKKAPRKNQKSQQKPAAKASAASALAPTLRAEAPEFVPTFGGLGD